MKRTSILVPYCFILLSFLATFSAAYAQCMTYPVPLETRESLAEHIVLGKLVAQHPYWDAEHANIYTLNIIEVSAWLKGYQAQTEIGVITLGGTLETEAQISHPALELAPWNEYVLFLKANESALDNRAIRQARPGLIQALPSADAQGALTKQMGRYHDLHHLAPVQEADLFAEIEALSGESARTPAGTAFTPRPGDTYPLSEWSKAAANKTAVITSFAPNPTHAGTIVPGDFITIDGTAFGAAPGTVFYTNANDGGATLTSSGVATDNVAWSATQITNKPAGDGGTGPININGTQTSAGNLTINYAHIEINSSFAGFAQSTRQRYHLIDNIGAGHYFMRANANITSNNAAFSAFMRAVETWRCATGFFVEVDEIASVLATIASDGENSLLFDATLPNGVLGRATSRFQASATGICNQTNTVWWLNELDIQFKPNPPSGGTTWNFGPAASTFLQFDFESVALHEFGHAHGLGHVIDPGAVMHFAIANGTDARVLSTNDINGGLAKMAYSSAPLCFNPAGVVGPFVPSTVGCVALPASLTLQARHLGGSNLLEWAIESAETPAGFFVERSSDGQLFETLQFVGAQPHGNTESTYQFTDAELPGGTVYYRIVQRDQNGIHSMSNVVAVQANVADVVEVFPTVVTQSLQVRGQATQRGQAHLRFVNLSGQQLQEVNFAVEAGTFQQKIFLKALPAGIFFYQLTLPDGNRHTGKLVRQ